LGKVIAKNLFNRLIISALRLFHSLGGVSQVTVADGVVIMGKSFLAWMMFLAASPMLTR
jgi:hypothetical protein